MNKEDQKRMDVATMINWILTTALIVLLMVAVYQGYFEDRKCAKWVENRVIELQGTDGPLDYNCTLLCNSTYPLADKSAKEIDLGGIGK